MEGKKKQSPPLNTFVRVLLQLVKQIVKKTPMLLLLYKNEKGEKRMVVN
jgi:hypothetical protein